MAKLVFRRGNSITRWTYEEGLTVEEAEKAVPFLNKVLQEQGCIFSVQLDPPEVADWFIDYTPVSQMGRRETATYQWVYTCKVCEARVAANTGFHVVCPVCSAPLNN